MKKLLSLFLSCVITSVMAAPVVSVDIGHYIQSPGTISAYGDYEFYYNKALAQFVAQSFQQNGYSVNLIGFNGDAKDLVQRARLADGSQIFVSIHHDAVQAQDLSQWNYQGKSLPYNDKIKGFGVFVSAKNPYFQQSLQCAKIVAENLIKTGFTPNYYHNQPIPNEGKRLFFAGLPVYQYDNLIVLKSAQVPAILIEAGVLTNRQEAQWIIQYNVRQAFANTVAQSISACLHG